MAQQESEANWTSQLFQALKNSDVEIFLGLLPPEDSVRDWLAMHRGEKPQTYGHAPPKEYPRFIPDSMRKDALENFTGFLDRSKMLKIHWPAVVFMRYRFEETFHREGFLSEQFSDLRMNGFVFFQDRLTRKIFGFQVKDLFLINGLFYGGTLMNIVEASTPEEYVRVARKEAQWLSWAFAHGLDTVRKDTVVATRDVSTDENIDDKLVVVDRRYYIGWFDEEIPVQLYVRYYKSESAKGVYAWDALFRFARDEYVKMEVSKINDIWIFEEELGVMELSLNGKIYSGNYILRGEGTGYEVRLEEKPLSNKKLKRFDEILTLRLHL